MDLEELKRIRKANIIAHKKKKQAYYRKKKLVQSANTILNISKSIDYDNELFSGNFVNKIKEIAKKQKLYVDNRQEIIHLKIKEYREKKQQYYKEHKKERLEYDKEYRDKKREALREYRRKYYAKNREKILGKQKEARKKQQIRDQINVI